MIRCVVGLGGRMGLVGFGWGWLGWIELVWFGFGFGWGRVLVERCSSMFIPATAPEYRKGSGGFWGCWGCHLGFGGVRSPWFENSKLQFLGSQVWANAQQRNSRNRGCWIFPGYLLIPTPPPKRNPMGPSVEPPKGGI